MDYPGQRTLNFYNPQPLGGDFPSTSLIFPTPIFMEPRKVIRNGSYYAIMPKSSTFSLAGLAKKIRLQK